MKSEKGFWALVIGIVAVLICLVVFGHMAGCGPSPYPPCTAAQHGSQRCDGKAPTGVEADGAYIARCDGVVWSPVMECNQNTDADGILMDEVCREEEDGPACQSR